MAGFLDRAFSSWQGFSRTLPTMDPARPLLFAAVVVAASLACGARAAAQTSADAAFTARVRALALDERCDLFSDDVRLALDAGAAQSRNALLRAGWTDTVVLRAAVLAAADAEAASCAGSDAAAVVSNVTSAYEAWRQLKAMTFAGDHRTWAARRLDQGEGWLLAQNVADVRGGPAIFGVARKDDGEVRVALALPREMRPRAARLLVRDRAIASTRVESELVRLAGRGAIHPLAGAAAPDVFTRAIWGAERSNIDADSAYAKDVGGPAALLWFPESAIQALAELDPREAVAIEIDLAFRGEERTERLYVEIGDFAPAAMFTHALGQPSLGARPPALVNPASPSR
jgi:hypothetical protein